MLENPKFGWVTIQVGDYIGPASYLTDVGLDCMENMIWAIENHQDFTITFDCEGWSFKIIADDYRTFIIEEKNEPKLYVIEDIDKNKLACEIYNDIKKDFDDWKVWAIIDEEESNEYICNFTDIFNKYKQCLIKNKIIENIIHER